MKSPTMKEALAPLRGLEKELRDQWHSDCGDAAVEAKLAELDKRDRQKKARTVLREEGRAAARDVLSGDAPDRRDPRHRRVSW